jgi:hypothetical protein
LFRTNISSQPHLVEVTEVCWVSDTVSKKAQWAFLPWSLLRTMLASLRIHTFICHPQPLHRLPADDMQIHDLVHIRGRYACVPNALGIYDNVRAMLALVEASGLVRANRSFQPALRHRRFEQFVEFPTPVGIATPARMSRIALIGTHKNMLLEFCHDENRITDLAYGRVK